MTGTTSKKLPSGAIEYLLHHIFLPPKLPDGDDFKSEHETILLDITIDALSKFKGYITSGQIAIIDSVIAMVANLRTVRDSGTGSISEMKLRNALRDLCEKGGTVPLHLRAQNTGIIISKVADSLHLEAFELSPLNQEVITTKGRLRRSFPGPAISLSAAVFESPSFQETTAQTLAKMSHQSAVETMPQARKAGRMHDEDRDTVHPKIVTELFMGFLRSVGKPANLSRLWKNTREEVMYHDSRRPWQRSPLWLLVRVTMQLVFSRSTVQLKPPGDLYKMFMVFLMSHVLELSHQHPLSNDLTYAMNAKLARRLLKLDPSVDGPGLHLAEEIMRKTNELLHDRWSNVMEREAPLVDLSRLKRLDFDRDAFNSLPKLDKYIELIAHQKNKTSSVAFRPRSDLVKHPVGELPTDLESHIIDYRPYNLLAFEAWVAANLSLWLEVHKGDHNTCGKLDHLIRMYHGVASSFYSNNAEAISIMLITILELWIACDESATQTFELLRDYDPGIPQEFLESLVLPFKFQMERLFRAEDYLNRRRARAKFPAPHIFQDFGSQTSFSVRYFNQSPEHQNLLRDISLRATETRQKKRDELRQKKEQYKNLMQLHDQSKCEYYEVIVDEFNDFREQRHRSPCKKCNYETQAAALRIWIHEWPLPKDDLEARSTVFELKVPPSFGHWREATVFLLLDVLKSKYTSKKSPRSYHPLESYTGLSKFFTPFDRMQRISLLSQNKPHEVTHRRNKVVAIATESDVCLDNGLQYQYHDSRIGCFVDNFCVTDEMPKQCTYKLPAQSSSLQRFLFRPTSMPNGPPPNTVIASQSDCPDHISLDEYKALSTLPLGYRIQWQNILLQLSVPSVDFKKVETCLVILQSIYQAGPPCGNSILRAGHDIVDDEDFAHSLLGALEEALQRVKENWESSQALSTFSSLATRLLSLTSKEQIEDKCLAYLTGVRVVAFGWVNLLRDKAHKATNDDQRIDLSSKAIEIALICVDSFNLDETYLDCTLSVPKDASVFIQCSIIIQEGDLSISNTSDPMISILHHRWKRLSYRTYPILSREVLEKRSGCLDEAIERSWSAYQAGNDWSVTSEQVDHWLVSQTAPQGNNDRLWIHFNLLTCELLVNGLPLAHLPSQYERHPMYRTLFGNSTLEVMPTSVQGKQFSGKKEYAGYALHFGIEPVSDSSEVDLLVQAVKGDRMYELVPSRIFRGDFPVAFIDGFVHWYDKSGSSIEFRPIEDPWTSSPDNWKLMRSRAYSWLLTKDRTSLVGVASETAKVLSGILSPLEDPLQIHVIFNHSSSSLEIELPRLQLAFHLESPGSLIQSRQFRGMSIDSRQSLGTLVGLHNKLVLKHGTSAKRLVILPEGSISYQLKGEHIHVTMDKDSAVRAHAYHIDDQIGRLVDNESLQSKLFLSYLHALTSFCLPDPLLHRTGTEQALSILRSAAVRSFDRLSHENVEILGKIAQLTPGRTYYPANERVMQTVHWSQGLGFLAQHGAFHKCVKSIFDQADEAKVFYPDSYTVLPQLDQVNSDLWERDCIRSSTFRVSGFGAEDHTVNHDKIYPARDREQNSVQGFKAFVMSSVIYQGRAALQYDVPWGFRDRLWTFLMKALEILGPGHPLPFSELKYDAGFLQDSSRFISKYWSTFQRTFSGESGVDRSRFDKMIWFSTLAFAKEADMDIIQTLASFSTVPAMAQISAPSIDSFRLHRGRQANKPELRDLVKTALFPFRSCPEASITAQHEESQSALQTRRQRTFQSNQSRAIDGLVSALETQWPCEVPTAPIGDSLINFSTYLDVGKAIKNTKPIFKTWFENHRFSNYLGQIEDTLRSQMISPMPSPLSPIVIPAWNLQRRRGFMSIDDVLASEAPVLSPRSTRNMTDLLSSATSPGETTPRLAALIERIEAQASSNYEKDYIMDLRESLSSLMSWGKEYSLQTKGVSTKEVLARHLKSCQEHVHKVYSAIQSALTSPMKVEDSPALQMNGFSTIAFDVKQCPRLSPIFLLQQLSRARWQRITVDWKHCIIHYGLALSDLQRAERLVILSGKDAELIKELQNTGHTNWSPFEYPESLLLEVESGITIREVQEQIARKMRDPPSGKNAVMQLNMGEGKSSVVVPIVAVPLADGSRLVRVIVAKPQSKQMFQMLVSKIGGLLDRRVYHMPFSRALKLGEGEANAIGNIYKECMTNGGILLVQPEHILSFKLMGLECLISGKNSIGRSLLSTQEFFDMSSRDIVDESDENFSVKFELIYTMGIQRPVELSPERWICIQQVLDLVKMFVPIVAKEFPASIEVNERWPGSFPRTRILRLDAGQKLSNRIAEHICETGLNGFPIARQPEPVRQAVFRYITEPNLTTDAISQVENQGPEGFWAVTTRSTLLLLRGLIAGGVLAFAFGQKRWRVNYGLDVTRRPGTKLALPYRAKDNPTPRSEFSHPDVVIVLTSLSYYYGGLTNEDLFLAFGHLLKSDQADIEYQIWVKDAPNLPSAFHYLVGINLKDRIQCIEQVFPPLRYAKGAVDYFLAHIVFPKEMKEFPHKLSASGWDIGRIKAHPTTGFSGTNDSRKVLPLSVDHLDLQEQKHTNALVLEYLLQAENSVALMPPQRQAIGSDAELLLAMVTEMKPTIQVILDVGAQILELNNLEVARKWLKVMSGLDKTQAVVFFNDSDELSVLDRKGNIEPLQTSSFAKQLDVCLVFLDEAHTRGTDLSLPSDYRAAVTLGPNLTKDRLVQACMRMRKLGKGQSVVFCVPEEIKTKILAQTDKPGNAVIDVSDVLGWAISETYVDIRRSMPLWAAQGQRFENQGQIWAGASTAGAILMSKDQADKFLEEEARSLEDRYRPRSGTDVTSFIQESENKNLGLIMNRCREFNNLEFNSATFQEEQERELSPEIEQERQVQKPPPAKPADHEIHRDLAEFVWTGIPISCSEAYRPAFEVLCNTSAAKYLDVSQFPQDLLTTTDFARTVQTSGTSYISDAYQRPVQWILTSTGGGTSQIVKYMVIISPYEAQELLPRIRKFRATALHLYAPRPSLSFRSLDGLDLYTVAGRSETHNLPRSLVVQLNLFAGQLYLGSFNEYVEVCKSLGLAWKKTKEGFMVAADGFIIKGGGGSGQSGSSFKDSPVEFLKVLMTKIRRNCESIDKTHMGKILDGRLLLPSDFEESELEN